jgi:hypothetical protein
VGGCVRARLIQCMYGYAGGRDCVGVCVGVWVCGCV